MTKKLSDTPLIDPTAQVRDSTLGRYTEVGARTKVAETVMGDYSYVVNDADIIYTTIGKFVSIAAHTRINPGNHPMQRATQAHFTYRASTYFEGEPDEDAFFDWRRSFRCHIGHDVWIGHGAIVLPGRSIGTGNLLAQVDQEGGGEHDRGRAKSPLVPDVANRDGTALSAQRRRIDELEAR
ncbi:MAG: hypothetical protein ACOVOI_09070, partial [Hyphomicrobiales bacterium]